MSIRIYNTLTNKKEPFETIQADKVLMYVCGPTVYDACHVGHARSAVVFDVIVRYLRMRGYQVVYVRNFTDVDDKIIRRAQELGVSPQSLADKHIDEYYRDMGALYVERATFEPRVTEHIEDIIRIIEKLVEKGAAYQRDGDVFFAIESFEGYGKLSNRDLDDMSAGARVEIDKRKKNPFDFTLWKSSKPGEPSWESPWGKGRPGWHIECSAMSSKYLGETFDIHGGGKDLIFPHHENEIAQSEAAHGKQFVRYWIHNGFVNIDQKKMSKSLGNFMMIKDVIQTYHPETVRLFLLSKQYRKPIDFNRQAMSESAAALDRIYKLLLRMKELEDGLLLEAKSEESGSYWDRFCEVMDDDFNTARGIAVIFDAVRHANRLLDQNTQKISSDAQHILNTIRTAILKMGHVLGILNDDPRDHFSVRKTAAVAKTSIEVDTIEQLIQERNAARKARNWHKADQIRDRLLDMNISLEDGPEGTSWKIDT